jgi:hypothetical protein
MHPDTTRRARLLYIALAFLGLDLPLAAKPSASLDIWYGIASSRTGWRARIGTSRSRAPPGARVTPQARTPQLRWWGGVFVCHHVKSRGQPLHPIYAQRRRTR